MEPLLVIVSKTNRRKPKIDNGRIYDLFADSDNSGIKARL